MSLEFCLNKEKKLKIIIRNSINSSVAYVPSQYKSLVLNEKREIYNHKRYKPNRKL